MHLSYWEVFQVGGQCHWELSPSSYNEGLPLHQKRTLKGEASNWVSYTLKWMRHLYASPSWTHRPRLEWGQERTKRRKRELRVSTMLASRMKLWGFTWIGKGVWHIWRASCILSSPGWTYALFCNPPTALQYRGYYFMPCTKELRLRERKSTNLDWNLNQCEPVLIQWVLFLQQASSSCPLCSPPTPNVEILLPSKQCDGNSKKSHPCEPHCFIF